MKRLLIAVLINCGLLHAVQAGDMNLFVRALTTGSASAPLPTEGKFSPAIKSLQTLTGDTGPIIIEARRIVRFQQQAHCGRVGFIIVQPSAKRGWPELGGQLNICEDGAPPWKFCKGLPNVLVAPNQACADKSPSLDTPEVAQAIRDAIASGSLSESQVLQRSADDAAKKKKLAVPAGGAR